MRAQRAIGALIAAAATGVTLAPSGRPAADAGVREYRPQVDHGAAGGRGHDSARNAHAVPAWQPSPDGHR